MGVLHVIGWASQKIRALVRKKNTVMTTRVGGRVHTVRTTKTSVILVTSIIVLVLIKVLQTVADMRTSSACISIDNTDAGIENETMRLSRPPSPTVGPHRWKVSYHTCFNEGEHTNKG